MLKQTRQQAHLFLCHHLNALHIYCRLRQLRIPHSWAMKASVWWEKKAHPLLYKKEIMQESTK